MKRRDPFYPRPRRLSASRKRIELMATGGIGALAAALCLAPPGWAASGSFQGSVATSVNANISTTATTTDVNIFGNRAIIEWNPSDADINATAPVDFQPVGTTATFSSTFLTDFTVLNIVNAPGSRVIGLNGTVQSKVSDGANGMTTGGAVWFYSRNGFLVGANARFDVGSLLLTANRPDGAYDPQSQDGYNHEFDNQSQSFNVEQGRSGTITISPGAQINASNYVALIAPHIVQGGTVRANGEIAYVGAEAVDMSLPLNGGLFGISITTGTDGVGITHTGSTGGPATDASDRRRNVYMVTVPKNDAVTMLISGSIGYDTAQSATTLSDGTLLLAGGGTTVNNGTFTSTSKIDLPGTIKISDASFSNNVTAVASHLTVDSAQADLTFAGNATLRGVYDASMTIAAGRTATVGGDLALQGWGLTDPNIGSQESGTASLTIGSGATLAIRGALTVDASGQGYSPLGQAVEQQNGTSGTGGTATLTVNDGTINGGKNGNTVLSAGPIVVTADGLGGGGYVGGGDGNAGTASIVMNGGSILGSTVLATANGLGGGSESIEAASGAGYGGTAEIRLLKGASTSPSLAANTSIIASATGTGGAGSCYYCYDGDLLYYAAGATGGAGLGGTARVTMSAGTIAAPQLLAIASAQGGAGLIGAGPSQVQGGYSNGGDGGSGTGGTALIDLSGGTATIGDSSAFASATGGQGGDALIGEGGQSSGTGNAGSGGAAMGGDARIQVAGTSLLLSGEGGNSFSIHTSAVGGNGGSSEMGNSGNGGAAGHLANTVARLQIGTGASVQLDRLTIDATAAGGDGGDYTNQAVTNAGGSATGGAIEIAQTGGDVSFSTSSLAATALRGIGGNRGDNFRGSAGNATGGSILTQTSGGSLSLGTLSLDASGIGKVSEASTTLLEAGAGQGGSITLKASGSGMLSASEASLSAAGRGGDGYIDANSGKAGQILIQAQDSSRITFSGAQIVADASAKGGSNAHGVNVGGAATGGSIQIEADDTATITLPTSTSLLVGAAGGGNAAIGGQGAAGLAQIVASGGTITGGALTIGAAGTGGDANASVSGGNIQLTSSGAIQFTGAVDLDASGIGSTGGGFGGLIGLTTTGGQGLSLADTTLSVDGVPGSVAGAGGITIQASASGITFASLDAHALGDATTAERIAVSGLGAQVHSLGTTQFRTSGNLSLTASGAGGIAVDGDLTVTTPGTVTLSHSQPAGQTLHAANATFSVGDFTSGAGTSIDTTTSLSINATGAITLDSATSGDVVNLTGVQGVQIGGVFSSGTAVLGATGTLDPSHARVSINAGDSMHAADITINQRATASGTVNLSASGDIIVAGGATVRSNNLTQLVAGNDILVRAGANVTGAAVPLNANSGSLALTAGGGETPQPSVHSIILDGTLDGFAAPVTLTADAIQADSGTIRGGSLTTTLVTVPFNGSPLDSDGGQLFGNCTGGSICLGGVTLTGALDIGQTGATPANLVLAGNIDAGALNLRARDLMVLGNSQAPITIHSTGQGSLTTVGTGSISTAGNTTLTTAGDLLLSTYLVAAPALSAQAGGNLLLSVGRYVSLSDAIAAGRIASPGSSLSPVSLNGAFTVLGTLQAGAGPLDINAIGISINRLKTANGVALHLASGSTADVSITDGSASTIGSAASASISGRAITIGQLASAGPVSLNGSGAVQVTTDLASAGAVSAQGASVSIKSLGALTFASLIGTSGDVDVNAAGALTVPSASAAGALSLTSGGNLGAGSLSAQTTLGLNAAGLLQVDTNLTAGGAISVQGGSVALTLGNATSIASGVATAGDLVIHNAGALTLTSGSATGGVDLTGSGITIGTASAGGLFKAVATGDLAFTSIGGNTVQLTAQGSAQGNAISGGTLTSAGTATLLAGDAITVSTDFATGAGSSIDGRSVSLTSIGALAPAHIGATGGGITLRSGGDLTLTDANATGAIDIQSTNGLINATGLVTGSPGVTARGTSVTLGAAGPLTVASATATAGDLAVTTGGNLAVTSGSATGAIRLISNNGAVTFGSLSIGSDFLLHAHDSLSLSGLTLSGSLDLASSAGAIDIGPITAGGTVSAQAATNLGFTTVSGSTLSLTATSGTLSGNSIGASDGATLVAGGALNVDTNVAVAGPLSATGASVALTTTGALAPANIIATNGGITLRSTGALTLTQANATGTLDIQSTGGAVNASGFTAGGGLIARGTAVTLTAAGPLTVTSAIATAGDLVIHDGGALTLTSGSATGGVDLTGSGIEIGTASAGGLFKAVATGNLGFTNVSGGTVQLTAQGGQQSNAISGAILTSTGPATLLAGDGATVSTDFNAGSGSRVDGSSVSLTSLGGLSLAHVGASGGDITLHSLGDLTLADASSSGAIDIRSANGLISATGLSAGSPGVTARGTGVTLGSIGALTVANAAATAGDLIVDTTGNLTVTGASASGAIRLSSAKGSLSATTLTPGSDLLLRAANDLTIGNLTVTGTIDLASTAGAIGAGAISAGGDIKVTAATNFGFTTVSGNVLTLTATGGTLTGSGITAAGDATLNAGGVLVIGNTVTVAGQFDVAGRSVALTAPGALTVHDAVATAGDLVIHDGGALTLTSGSATGGVQLTGSGITIGTVSTGGLFKAVATGGLAFTKISGGTVQLTAQGGAQGNAISGGTLTSTGAATLLASDAISIGTDFATGSGSSVDGSGVTLTSVGALALAHVGATNGSIQLRSGGDLTLAQGIASGGIDIRSSNGLVNASGLVTGLAGVTASGTSVMLAAPGSLKVAAALATAGDLDITAAGNLVITAGGATGAVRATSLQGSLNGSIAAGGDLSLRSAATLTLGDLNGNGTIDLASSGGAISTGAISAKGDVSIDAATDIGFTSISGRTLTLSASSGMLEGNSIAASSGATLKAGGSLAITTDIAVTGAFKVSGGRVALTSTGPLSLTSAHANAGDLVVHTGNGLTLGDGGATGSVALTSGGSVAIDTLTAGSGATLTAADALTIHQDAAVAGLFSATGRSVTIQAANSLSLTNATATGGDLTLTALNGGITGTHLSATGAAHLIATGAILSGDISAGGGVTAAGSSIDLTAPGALTLTSATASAGDLIARAAGDLTLLSGSATRSISLVSTGGAVNVHDASVGGVQTLRSLTATATNSGDIAIDAATAATLDGTIGTGGAIRVSAASANVTGSVIGRTISFATRGITIGASARIGQAGATTAVTFTNNGTRRSFVGGTSGDGYLLTAAGLGRVQADAITLNLPAAADGSAANPDVTINDLTLHGSTGTATGTLANLTSIGSFTINTPGRVRISGKLQLTDLAPTNSASIIAGPEIDVVTPTGAILMTDSGGTATGDLMLAAQRIIVASQSALTDLASISGTDARSSRLATNDGPVTDQGYLAANRLAFRIATILDVQNSGGTAPEDRRGITAGAGGIDIGVTAPGTPEIILNGRQLSSAAFAGLIRVAAADGSFTPVLANGSTVNGCLVSTGCNTTPSTETLLGLILPQQDVIGMLDDGSNGDDDKKSKDGSAAKSGAGINRPLITIVRANPYGFGSIIDEPVTGTPNDDLWIDQPAIGVGNINNNGGR
ncbi:hypothetical protein [Sphingomonas sp. MMS24-J13]|uniref:hypothetical protein n=1 Tax=Sphingomonas sp. MMS24-J13 TaxID=3238686 RepID=UPI003850D3AC